MIKNNSKETVRIAGFVEISPGKKIKASKEEEKILLRNSALIKVEKKPILKTKKTKNV